MAAGRAPTGPAAEQRARALVDRYANLILRLSYTYLKSTYDAEDVCQDIIIKLMNREGRFSSPAHERAWVIRATKNACKDMLRQAQRKTLPLEELGESSLRAHAPEPPHDEVLDAVMALPASYREAVFLKYFEGYSSAQIAKILGCKQNTVDARLSRARAKLRSMLRTPDAPSQRQRKTSGGRP